MYQGIECINIILCLFKVPLPSLDEVKERDELIDGPRDESTQCGDLSI